LRSWAVPVRFRFASAKDLAAVRPDVVETLVAKLDAFPRGEDVALPLWRVVFDPGEFGE
jgi:hypothetical protein